MPSGPRIRTDNVYGTLSAALGGAAGDLTMNSAGLANLAAVSSAHAVIVIDPLRTGGAPEIVVVTAHTGSATTATITRGAYGTTRRAHALGTLWVHAPTREDFIQILTTATRPSDPHRGQLIFETDTDALVGRSVTDVWIELMRLGAWQTYTPTLTQSGAVAKTVNYARFARLGRTIVAAGEMTVTGAGTAGVGIVIGLPVAASFGSGRTLGGGSVFDASAGLVYTAMPDRSGSTTTFRLWPTSTDTNNVLGAAVFTAALAAGDVVDFHVTYEAAA